MILFLNGNIDRKLLVSHVLIGITYLYFLFFKSEWKFKLKQYSSKYSETVGDITLRVFVNLFVSMPASVEVGQFY